MECTHEALVEPAGEGCGLRGSFRQDAMGHDQFGDLRIAKQTLECFDRAPRLVKAHLVHVPGSRSV